MTLYRNMWFDKNKKENIDFRLKTTVIRGKYKFYNPALTVATVVCRVVSLKLLSPGR